MKTRQDYLDGKCTHEEYYAQFVTPAHKSNLTSYIGSKHIKQSKEAAFNDIPLKNWDSLPKVLGVNEKMKQAGDYLTMSGHVCVYKEADRQMRENN